MRIKKNKKKLIIIGGEGVGEIAANIAEQSNQFEKIYFLNDRRNKTIGRKKFSVIGKTSLYKKYLLDNNYFFFYAILDYKNQGDRTKNFKKIPKKKYVNIIHENSYFDRKIIENKKNILICNNVGISSNVTIGDSVHLMANSFVGHNTKLSNNVFVGACACIGGNVTIKENSFIGLNATIIENIKISRNSIVGAGSVILQNIKPYEIFIGNAAKSYQKI